MNKKYLRNTIILVLVVTALTLLWGRLFKKGSSENIEKDRALFAYFIDKSVHAQNYTQFDTYINSCRSYTDSLSPTDIDSLKSFLTYYMKFNDDVYTDIINSVQDSGTADTLHIFRPATLAEAKEICTQSGKKYANWQKGVYSMATLAQQQRNELGNTGNPWDITDAYKQKLTVTRIRRDSLYRKFYNGVFAGRK